ncbi:hypothetical protein [Streptosporangium pseudovulgare]|nr:hypothetical protein [Streptosporangium pseudovulgare]
MIAWKGLACGDREAAAVLVALVHVFLAWRRGFAPAARRRTRYVRARSGT